MIRKAKFGNEAYKNISIQSTDGFEKKEKCF